jgi:hypothetical protein
MEGKMLYYTNQKELDERLRVKTELVTYFNDEKGQAYHVGNTVTIKHYNGGGMGGCTITKITKTGFRYIQGSSKEKSIQFDQVESLSLY